MRTLGKIIILKYLVLGFCIGLVVHTAHSCKKESSNTDNGSTGTVDTGKIDDAVKTVSAAFASGDVNNIKSVLTESALERYGNNLSKVSKTNLVKFGEALKASELKVGTTIYAEYNFTKDGKQFSIAMAKQEDGSWKLMRF